MDLFHNLIFGFGVALSLQNLLYCLIGVTVGTLIGVLPGIGPLGTIAILMPITYGIDRSVRSSCWRGFTTAPSTAARPPPSW